MIVMRKLSSSINVEENRENYYKSLGYRVVARSLQKPKKQVEKDSNSQK